VRQAATTRAGDRTTEKVVAGGACRVSGGRTTDSGGNYARVDRGRQPTLTNCLARTRMGPGTHEPLSDTSRYGPITGSASGRIRYSSGEASTTTSPSSET
jgi:hypothetical protein